MRYSVYTNLPTRTSTVHQETCKFYLNRKSDRPSRQLVGRALFQRSTGRESGVEQRCIQGSSLLGWQSVSLA